MAIEMDRDGGRIGHVHKCGATVHISCTSCRSIASIIIIISRAYQQPFHTHTHFILFFVYPSIHRHRFNSSQLAASIEQEHKGIGKQSKQKQSELSDAHIGIHPFCSLFHILHIGAALIKMSSNAPSRVSTPTATPTPSSTSSDAPRKKTKVLLREDIVSTLPLPEEGASDEPTFAVSYGVDKKVSDVRKNPLVPAGAMITAAVLMGGLFAFKQGNQRLSQQLMRARVLAQGATVCALGLSVNSIRNDGDEE